MPKFTSTTSKGTTEKRTVTFKYDPLGRRIEKKLQTVKNGSTKTTTFTYLYDNEDIVMETMTTGTTTEKTYYTHGPGIDEPLSLERNASFYYYHQDGLGSITAITNSSKAFVQSYTYDSFGMPKPTTSFRNSLAYAGKEWDWETGLHRVGVRYYDYIEGRFISRDPISFAGGDVNLYQYVNGNPVSFINPLGTDKVSATLGIMGAVSGITSLIPHPVVSGVSRAIALGSAGLGAGYATANIIKDNKVPFDNAGGIALAAGELTAAAIENKFPMSSILLGGAVRPLNIVSTTKDSIESFRSKPQNQCRSNSYTKAFDKYYFGY